MERRRRRNWRGASKDVKKEHATQRRGGNNCPKKKQLRFATYSCKGGEIEQIENWVKDIYSTSSSSSKNQGRC